jgi:hypothetical protein
MKIDNPMMYYTGVRTDPNLSVGVSGIWSIYINKINEFINYVESMSFEHYLDFARRAGASYIIISRDPGRGTFPTGIVENEYFVVMAIPLTSSSP